MRVQRRTLPDIGEVERSGEYRFHRRRPRVIGEPLNRHVRTKPLFEPAFALPRKRVSDNPLGVGDVWEMSKTNCDFVLGESNLREARASDRKDEKEFCFHGQFSKRSSRYWSIRPKLTIATTCRSILDWIAESVVKCRANSCGVFLACRRKIVTKAAHFSPANFERLGILGITGLEDFCSERATCLKLLHILKIGEVQSMIKSGRIDFADPDCLQ